MDKPKMIAFGAVGGGKFVVYTRQGEQTVKMTRREYLDAVMRGKNGTGDVEPEVVEVKDKVVETVIFERETIGVEIHKPQLWQVLSVSYDEIEFQCGNDIFVIRKPDIEE